MVYLFFATPLLILDLRYVSPRCFLLVLTPNSDFRPPNSGDNLLTELYIKIKIMIGKQVKGSSFGNALKYVEGKEDSRQIGTNMAGRNTQELTTEFRIAQNLNYSVTKPVFHCSLSTPPDEELTDEEWLDISKDYLDEMGFNNSQYVVYKHNDTDHHHVHIIANRVSLSGQTVDDSWDYPRSEVVIQKIAEKYHLKQRNKQQKLKKAPKTGEIRQARRTGKVPIRSRLQKAIDSVTGKDKMSLDEFREMLAQQQIQTRVSYSQNGKIQGISYKLDDIAFSGHQLGKAYSLNGLNKYKGVITEQDWKKSPQSRRIEQEEEWER